MIRLRSYEEKDRDSVKKTVLKLQRFYPGIEEWLDKQLDKIGKEDVSCLLLDVDNELAGLAIYGKESQQISTYKLKTFFIEEEFRELGIGNFLLNQVIDKIVDKKFSKIFVTFAEEEVKELLGYFKRYGFQLEGVIPYNYRPEISEYYMSKLQVYEQVDEKYFMNLVEKYLFKLRGYEVLERKDDELILRKLIAFKEPYKILAKILTKKNVEDSDIKEIEQRAKKEGYSSVYVISYYPINGVDKENFKLIDGYDVETLLYPLKLSRSGNAGWIIPVQPNWSHQLLYDPNQTLLVPDKKQFRQDNVFFRYPKLKNMERGQTIILYESDPTKAIVGEAQLKNFEIDNYQNIFDKYGKKGVVPLQEIKGYSNKKGEVAALEFRKGISYPQKISLESVKEILPKFNPQGTTSVSQDVLDKLRKRGGSSFL